jgi:hypothetical protein
MLKEFFKIFSVLVCAGSLVASDDVAVAQPVMRREQFTAADGTQFYVRQATVADFDNGNIVAGTSPVAGKAVIGSGIFADRRAKS